MNHILDLLIKLCLLLCTSLCSETFSLLSQCNLAASCPSHLLPPPPSLRSRNTELLVIPGMSHGDAPALVPSQLTASCSWKVPSQTHIHPSRPSGSFSSKLSRTPLADYLSLCGPCTVTIFYQRFRHLGMQFSTGCSRWLQQHLRALWPMNAEDPLFPLLPGEGNPGPSAHQFQYFHPS